MKKLVPMFLIVFFLIPIFCFASTNWKAIGATGNYSVFVKEGNRLLFRTTNWKTTTFFFIKNAEEIAFRTENGIIREVPDNSVFTILRKEGENWGKKITPKDELYNVITFIFEHL